MYKRQGLGPIISGVAVVLSFLLASAAAGQWEELLLYLNAQPFGIEVPIFGRDVAFYVFNLPVYRFIQGLSLIHI